MNKISRNVFFPSILHAIELIGVIFQSRLILSVIVEIVLFFFLFFLGPFLLRGVIAYLTHTH